MPQITLKGNPVKLPGTEVKVGQKAPDFKLQDATLADVTLANSAGKTRIIAAIPSLDTPVCALETKRFNEEAGKLPNVEVLVVSMDLPFGQKRWCGAEGCTTIKALSDHRTGQFEGGGFDRVFARAVFVVGPDNTVKHVEYVKEIAEHPNYDAVLAAAK
jgi:thiol peroxidase